MNLSDIAMKIAIGIKYDNKCKSLGIKVDALHAYTQLGDDFIIPVYWNPHRVIGKTEDCVSCKTNITVHYSLIELLKASYNTVSLGRCALPKSNLMDETILAYIKNVLQPIFIAANNKASV